VLPPSVTVVFPGIPSVRQFRTLFNATAKADSLSWMDDVPVKIPGNGIQSDF